ncbi:MAG: hypothetical protein N3B14_02995 [Thermoleophilia bacterium]|nr:hypothetical protein [Thermoleophilia bacterium]
MPLTIRRRLVDRVRQWRKIAYAFCSALFLFAGSVVFLSISSPSFSVELASGPTFFDAARAFRTAEGMSQYYPERALEAPDAQGVVEWILEKLPDRGMADIDVFTAPLGDRKVTLRNVAVILPGSSRETIVIAAPRDTPPVVKVEPLSYSTGTAVLLELIQVFSSRPHQKTLVFLSTEDSTTGGLGIDRYLTTSGAAEDVLAILSFQGLGKERSRFLSAGVTGAQTAAPGWYVQLVSRVLAEVGLDLKIPGLLSQAADHALAISEGDQVAGLSRGIPSLHLYDEGPGQPTAAGLITQGEAIERLILSLDATAEVPRDPTSALLLRSGRYLTAGAVTFLGVLMLLPSLFVAAIWAFSSRVTLRTLLRHLRNLASFGLPAVLTLGLMYGLAAGGLIPMYKFQVPTGVGPSTDPRLAPTLILLLVGLVFFILCRRFLGYFRPYEGRAITEMARLLTGYLGLLVGLILLLIRSPFLVIPMLTAAWAWPLATCFAEPVYSGALWRHRLTTNAPVLLLGLGMPLLLYLYLAISHGVGVTRGWWFLIVQTVSGAYGVLGPLGSIFILCAFAELAGVKRMRVVPIETLEAADELTLLEPPTPRSRRKPRQTTLPPWSPWR